MLPPSDYKRAHSTKNGRILKVYVSVFFVLLFLTAATFLYVTSLNAAPQNFPIHKSIVIDEGTSTRAIVSKLEEESLIRSPLYFRFVFDSYNDGEYIQAGIYEFPEKLSSKELAQALLSGEYYTPPLQITFPEGFRVLNMHDYLPETFDTFSLEQFVEKEGYLFPDTYYFSESTGLEEIVATLEKTFYEKIAPYEEEIAGSQFSLQELITLASILEREANDEESMRTVAGILIARLERHMPLQVDAAFEYLLGKRSDELTEEDLEIDSPYNTYTNLGLPPTPIANPGLQAIEAVLDPIETDYLYYLTGNDGKFYYAKTFDDHRENKELYLR